MVCGFLVPLHSISSDMHKRLVSLLAVLLAVVVGVSIWVLFPKTEEPVPDTLFDAIPLDAGLIIDIRNYGELCRTLNENGVWNVLRDISSLKTIDSEMMLLDSLTYRHGQTLPFRNNMIFSFHPVGKEEIQSIGYVRMDSDKEVRNLTDLIKERLSGKAVISQRTYDQVNITEVVFNDKKQQSYNFSYACRSGIFVFSRSSILLEHAIRQIVADSHITDRGKLAGLMQSSGKNSPANIYINYSQLPRTALTFIHDRHRKLLEPLIRFADWTELDLNVKSDLLLFNGFTECNNYSDQWLATLLSQPANSTTLADAMPSTTYAYLWLGIQQLQQYFADYGHYLDQNKESDLKKELDRLKNSFQIDLQKDFIERFENEVALVYANVGQEHSDEAFVLVRIKSASSTIDMIEKWQDAVRKSKTNGVDRQLLVIDNQLTFKAYQLPFDVPASLFGDIFAGGNQWCAIVDNYLVFSNSPNNLQKYLHYTALHASLQTDIGYGKLVNLFSTRSNLLFYCNPLFADDFFGKILKNSKYKEVQQSGTVSQMQALVYQLNNSSGKLYNNLFLKYSSSNSPVVSGMQTSWESLLDTSISVKPQLVQNHYTGETEIFVQDMANNIYLLNNVGRILWKVKLPESIISPVYQIDIYRNGKLQMLFNTTNNLYVIDRLGKFVDKFPVTVKSPAVGSIALFDYDNNRQYRMMIACEDRKVYTYDKTGKLVDGWSFKQSEHPVQTDIYHYRAAGKDFIVFADKYRVYILDRQGRTRVTPEQNIPVSRQTMIALDQQKSRLALTDTSGTIHFISLIDGSMTNQKIKTFPSSHIFVCQDVNGDGQSDYIFTSGNKLEVFGQDTKQITSIETDEPITMRPYIYQFSATDLRIGIVQPQNNQIWLYDIKGKPSNGFPLKGSTLFSIDRIDKSSNGFNLFVGSKNKFLYNYSINKQ